MVRWQSDLMHSLGKRTSRESGAESLNLSLTAIGFNIVVWRNDSADGFDPSGGGLTPSTTAILVIGA